MCFSSCFWPSWRSGNMVLGTSSMVTSLLWWDTERGVEIRVDKVTSRVWFRLEPPTQDPQSATKQPVILIAIYEVNTFQGFLGSLTATLASTSNTRSVFWVQHWVFMRLQRGVLSLYKVDAVHKTNKQKNSETCWPPLPRQAKKKVKEIKDGKNSQKKSKLRLQSLSTHHGLTS